MNDLIDQYVHSSHFEESSIEVLETSGKYIFNNN